MGWGGGGWNVKILKQGIKLKWNFLRVWGLKLKKTFQGVGGKSIPGTTQNSATYTVSYQALLVSIIAVLLLCAKHIAQCCNKTTFQCLGITRSMTVHLHKCALWLQRTTQIDSINKVLLISILQNYYNYFLTISLFQSKLESNNFEPKANS